MDTGKSTEQELETIRSRADRIVPEEELRAKLDRARVEGRPLRVKYGIDPTGRNAERPGLTGEQVAANMERYARELFTVVDESRAELHYQSAWFDALSLDELLRTPLAARADVPGPAGVRLGPGRSRCGD